MGVDRRVPAQASFALTLPEGTAATAAKLDGVRDRLRRVASAASRQASSRTASGARRSPSSRWPSPASCAAAIGLLFGGIAAAAGRRVHRLGHQHRRRLRAVLRVDRRAGRPLSRRHDAHGADGAGVHADAGHDPPSAVLGRQRWAGATRSCRSAIGPAIGVCAMARLRAHPRVGEAGRRPPLAGTSAAHGNARQAYHVAAGGIRRPALDSHGGEPWPITSKVVCSKSATAACCARAGSARIPTTAPATRSSPGISTRARSAASTCRAARSR